MQAPLQARNDADAAKTDTARTVAQKRVLADNRPEAVAQRKLAEMMNNSPRVLRQRALSDAIHNGPRMVAQRHEMNALFGGAVKPQGDGAMPAEASLAQREEKTNNTGLPNRLKSGIESLSGMSMDHVTVHYNSDKPAQLQAHAYAQGSEIHLGAGQERHLPHEAWHVVQQAQGRVRPTLQMKAGAINDDPSLESEADRMGAKAAQFKGGQVARNFAPEESTEGGLTQRVAGFHQMAPVGINDDAAMEREATVMGAQAGAAATPAQQRALARPSLHGAPTTQRAIIHGANTVTMKQFLQGVIAGRLISRPDAAVLATMRQFLTAGGADFVYADADDAVRQLNDIWAQEAIAHPPVSPSGMVPARAAAASSSEQKKVDDESDDAGELEASHNRSLILWSMGQTRPAAAASSEERKEDDMRDVEPHRRAWAREASRKHKRVDDSEDDKSVDDSGQEGGESDEEFIVQTPKKGSKKKNPMSMIKPGTRHESQGGLEYETRGGARHRETQDGQKRKTETTGLTYSNEFRNPAHRPVNGYTVHNPYGLSKGQRSRNQMVVSHNSPSWAGMQAGCEYGNSSLTSPTYNSAIEKKESDWRETLKNSSTPFSYKTETEYENVRVEDAPAIYQNLQTLPFKNTRWSEERIRDRLGRVAERHPESERVSKETRELQSDSGKRVFTQGRDYRAFLPARAYDRPAHTKYLEVRPEDSEGSDKELEPPEKHAKKKRKTEKPKK